MAWLTGWNRRKSKTVVGSTAGTVANYQLQLNLFKGAGTDTNTDIYFNYNVRDDFGDVRFTSSDGSTLLDYWIESNTLISGTSCKIWIEVDSIPADPNTAIIYIYYSKPTEITTSNGSDTFQLFDDDWNGVVTGNSTVWIGYRKNIVDTYGKTVSNSELTLTPQANTHDMVSIRSINTFADGFELVFKSKGQSNSNSYSHFGQIGQDGVPTIPAGQQWNVGALKSGYLSYVQSSLINAYCEMDRFNSSGSMSWLSASNNFPGEGTNYHLYKTQIYNGSIKHIYDDTTVRSAYDTTYQNNMYVLIGAYEYSNGGGEPRTIDYAYVRKYIYPEPTFSISGLEETPACPLSPKYEGDVVHLSATPKDGIGPYSVEFIKSIQGINTSLILYTDVIEDIAATYDYILTNEDIRSAYSGTINFSVIITDSCPTIPQTCTETCTINIGCYAPICNFTVT